MKPYASVLFIDFSAFNPIQPDILLSKMHQMEIDPNLIHWYCSFLINRQQLVLGLCQLTTVIDPLHQ